ncbi:GroES-like protein [Diaporthe amygdali]|uniref:GroES-like protein n=1 Tax=Phomopsis amygdali TaxID=1214568 RepID=UPI0022FEF524|nr:GroES-like protein [Diaporthe amygdali]KAJ0118916.1 GroES-like protein [Diaporthe amygdali]
MEDNRAAWLVGKKVVPLEVKPAPLEDPDDNQVLVKNHAIAVNPIDVNVQYNAPSWMETTYPRVLGVDVAGEVVAIGPNVTRFKKGDRVLGNAVGQYTKRATANGFMSYTILQTNMASPIPSHIPFEEAAVIPLCLSTAAAGLFQKDFMSLNLPTEPPRQPNGETLLIWGGATSVGCNAIQLAIAAGYEVITTASPKNFELMKRLGATQAFDYNSSTVIPDLIAAFEGRHSAGTLDCIGPAENGAGAAVLEVVSKVSAGSKFVATVKPHLQIPDGVSTKHVYALSIYNNFVSKGVYEDFLPRALEVGTFVPAPPPLIAGRGLESVQVGIDILRKGVSAQKVVVSL